MSSFMRPEAQAALHRWRDVLIAVLFACIGLYWAFTAFGILRWIGWLLVVAAALFAWSGLQRLWFSRGKGGVGVVTVKEGQITYLGPFEGGVAAITELSEIILDYSQDPPCWVLKQLGLQDVHIPLNAEGTDALFDVFASLPNMQTSPMLAALQKNDGHPIVIWQRRKHSENVTLLH